MEAVLIVFFNCTIIDVRFENNYYALKSNYTLNIFISLLYLLYPSFIIIIVSYSARLN